MVSKLSYLIEPLRDRLYNFETEIENFKKESGVKIVAYIDEIFPLEIMASFDIYQLFFIIRQTFPIAVIPICQ